MGKRVIAGMVLVAIWLLLGPVAMAFDGCMGCDLPCAQMAYATMGSVPTAFPTPITSATLSFDLLPVTTSPSTLELPPK